MSFSRVKPTVVAFTRGALAWLLAVTVFALGLLGAAPSAHDWLHSDDTDHAITHDDAGCAVTLFAHGATTPPELPGVIAPCPVFITSLAAEPFLLLLGAAHYLTPPACGPPCIG